MIIQTMTVEDVAQDLLTDRFAGWSYEGAYALADYMDALSAERGEDIKYNPSRWARDFIEFDGLESYIQRSGDSSITSWADVENVLVVLRTGGAIVFA